MGFDNFSDLRAQFPVTESLIYLNHAAVAPLVRPAAEAMKRFSDDGMLYGSLHYEQWLDAYEGVRRAAASMVNVTPAEIALMKNTS
jgi:cysteine desulfurase / selenocysteine lyase